MNSYAETNTVGSVTWDGECARFAKHDGAWAVRFNLSRSIVRAPGVDHNRAPVAGDLVIIGSRNGRAVKTLVAEVAPGVWSVKSGRWLDASATGGIASEIRAARPRNMDHASASALKTRIMLAEDKAGEIGRVDIARELRSAREKFVRACHKIGLAI